MKYFKLLYQIFLNSLKAAFEFRTNFVLEMLIDFCWFFSILIVFESVSQMTQLSNGWSYGHFRFFAGIVVLNDALFTIFCFNSFEFFTNRVTSGSLDSLLLKPVDSQFMVFFEKSMPTQLVTLILAIIWILWSCTQIPDFNWLKLLWLLLLIPFGFLTHMSLRLIIASTNLRFVKLDSITMTWYQFYRMSQRPDFLYGRKLQLLFRSFLPISLISSVPAIVVLQEGEYLLALSAVVVAIALHLVARKYWQNSLKSYTSASS